MNEVLVGWVGCPTSQRPLVVPMAASRLPPAIRHSIGQNKSSYPSCTMHGPMLSFPLTLISSHQWGWGLLGWVISSVIQWQVYLTGSSLSLPSSAWNCEQDQLEETFVRTLGHAPPDGAGLALRAFGKCVPSLWSCVPPPRSGPGLKASPVSLPNSSSALKWTCFLGFSSFHRKASHQHALSLDSWDLGCNLRVSMEQWSHSSVGQFCGGLGEEEPALA